MSQSLSIPIIDVLYIGISSYQHMGMSQETNKDKLGLSCAKLRPAWASYQLAFVWLAFTEAAY